MAKVEKFPVSHAQRELNRRGKMALNCIVTDRWIKVADPYHRAFEDVGTPVEIEVLKAYSGTGEEDHKICSLTITVEQLRALLAEIEKKQGAKQ